MTHNSPARGGAEGHAGGISAACIVTVTRTPNRQPSSRNWRQT